MSKFKGKNQNTLENFIGMLFPLEKKWNIFSQRLKFTIRLGVGL